MKTEVIGVATLCCLLSLVLMGQGWRALSLTPWELYGQIRRGQLRWTTGAHVLGLLGVGLMLWAVFWL